MSRLLSGATLSVLGVYLVGCGDDPAAPPVQPSGVQTSAWQGSVIVTLGAMQGDVVLDVRASGSQLVGSIVMRWPDPGGSLPDPIVASLSGASTGSTVALSNAGPADTLTLALTLTDPSRLQGTITGRLGGQGVGGDLVLDRIPDAPLRTEKFLDLPQATTISMAVHNDTLWLSTTSNDFLLVTSVGNVVDQVQVEYQPGTYWTSTVLASGGGKLWGHLPHGAGATTTSRVLPFRREGILTGEFLLPHQSDGLAHDGTHLWSLDRETQKLYRLTEAGTVVDSVAVASPDLYQLAWDGAHFWSMGWFLPLLWKIEPDGDVIGVLRLDGALTGAFPQGVAADGSRLYVARDNLGTTSIARLEPVPVAP